MANDDPRWDPAPQDEDLLSALNENVRLGLMEAHVDPETGEYKYRVTEAGKEQAATLMRGIAAREAMFDLMPEARTVRDGTEVVADLPAPIPLESIDGALEEAREIDAPEEHVALLWVMRSALLGVEFRSDFLIPLMGITAERAKELEAHLIERGLIGEG